MHTEAGEEITAGSLQGVESPGGQWVFAMQRARSQGKKR